MKDTLAATVLFLLTILLSFLLGRSRGSQKSNANATKEMIEKAEEVADARTEANKAKADTVSAQNQASVVGNVAETVSGLSNDRMSSVVSLNSLRDALTKARAEKDEESALEVARRQAERAKEMQER